MHPPWFKILYANTPSWVLLQVYALQYSWWIRRSARADWSDPAEGRRRQVRKTSSKDVLSLSLWSKSRGPKRQTKRPQSPSAPLSFLRHFSFRCPPQVPASLSYLFLHWFLHISLTLRHSTNLLNIEFCVLEAKQELSWPHLICRVHRCVLAGTQAVVSNTEGVGQTWKWNGMERVRKKKKVLTSEWIWGVSSTSTLSFN